MRRRRFLQNLGALGLGGLGLGSLVPGGAPSLTAAPTGPTRPGPSPRSQDDIGSPLGERLLVLVELSGGNDGLNTLVPYTDPLYYQLRPQLALPRDQVLPLSPTLALHPALAPLKPLWSQGHLAIVRGVGYPSPNRSHFRSIDIWESASDADEVLDDGWLARLLAGAPRPEALVADGLVLGGDVGPLEGDGVRAIVMQDPEQLVRQARRLSRNAREVRDPSLRHILEVRSHLQQAVDRIAARLKGSEAPPVELPGGKFGRSLRGLVRILAAGLPVPVVKLSLGSFDTHAGQLGTHARLLGELAQGLAGLARVLQDLGLWERTLVMTYSEFGRRPAQNASGGTDHGTAAPHFLLGGAVRGGLYGRQPRLDQLRAGDLAHHVHFRDVYATVARRWFGLTEDFLGGKRAYTMGFLG